MAPDLTKKAVKPGKRCVVHLHGKGGGGAPTSTLDDLSHVYPAGNQYAWGGLEWRYYPDDRFEEVRATVAQAIASEGCERVILQGFSNGASAAAKLFCRGESFAQRLVGVVVEDPVPDHGVEGCKPASGVKVKLYATGALAHATDGWRCAEMKYTCDGGSTIGIARYAGALGTSVTQSENREHVEMTSPPEYRTWW